MELSIDVSEIEDTVVKIEKKRDEVIEIIENPSTDDYIKQKQDEIEKYLMDEKLLVSSYKDTIIKHINNTIKVYIHNLKYIVYELLEHVKKGIYIKIYTHLKIEMFTDKQPLRTISECCLTDLLGKRTEVSIIENIGANIMVELPNTMVVSHAIKKENENNEKIYVRLDDIIKTKNIEVLACLSKYSIYKEYSYKLLVDIEKIITDNVNRIIKDINKKIEKILTFGEYKATIENFFTYYSIKPPKECLCCCMVQFGGFGYNNRNMRFAIETGIRITKKIHMKKNKVATSVFGDIKGIYQELSNVFTMTHEHEN